MDNTRKQMQQGILDCNPKMSEAERELYKSFSLENNDIYLFPRRQYLQRFVSTNETYLKEICLRSKINQIAIKEENRVKCFCPNNNKYNCDSCNLYKNETVGSNYNDQTPVQRILAAAIRKIQQTISNHFDDETPIILDTFLKIAILSGDSLLNLIKLSGPYLFTKDAKVINIDKIYKIAPQTKIDEKTKKEGPFYFADMLRTAKDILIINAGIDNVNPKNMLGLLSIMYNVAIEEEVIKEILDTYII